MTNFHVFMSEVYFLYAFLTIFEKIVKIIDITYFMYAKKIFLFKR